MLISYTPTQRVASADLAFSDRSGDYPLEIKRFRYLAGNAANRCATGGDLSTGSLFLSQEEASPDALLPDACFDAQTAPLPLGANISRRIQISDLRWATNNRVLETTGDTAGSDKQVRYFVESRGNGTAFYTTVLNGVEGTVSVTKLPDGRYRVGLNNVRLLQSANESFYADYSAPMSGRQTSPPPEPPVITEPVPTPPPIFAPEPTPTPTPKVLTSVTISGEIIVEEIR